MCIDNFLETFDNVFMKYDSIDGKVLEIYPHIDSINLPCNILSILRLKKFNLNIAALHQIEQFVKKASTSGCINVEGKKGWYSLELIRINETEFYLHLFYLNNAMEQMRTTIYQEQVDPLTNALQKNAIQIYIDSVLKEHPKKDATMFMLDVDYFKNINDNYGHLFGDKVIAAVASALNEISGSSGKVGRIGGDEFIIFVDHDLDRLGMKNIARLIRYVLDNLEVDGKPFSVSATIGICQYPKDGRSFIELYTCCDKALYRGKAKGRDCHIIYDPLLHLGQQEQQDTKEHIAFSQKLSLPTFIGKIVQGFLTQTKETDYIVYKEIAEFFNLDRIILYRNQKLDLKYAKAKKDSNIEKYENFPLDEYQKNFIIDDMLFINDTRSWKLKDIHIYEIYEASHTVSLVQILTFDIHGAIDGFVSFEVTKEKRVWQRGELNAFATITKIINTFKNHTK